MNARDELAQAIIDGNTSVAIATLDKNPDLLNAILKDGAAALHLAVEYNNLELVKNLTDREKIDLNIKTQDPCKMKPGCTPVLLASYLSEPSISILQHLIDKNADLNIKTANGQTPLTTAIWNNKVPQINILLKTGKTDANVIVTGGHTVLTNAVKMCTVEIVQSILSIPGITIVNNKKKNGKSALFLAARQGDRKKVEALLQFPGIDAYASCTPGDGKAAFEIAQKEGHKDIAKLIQTFCREKMLLDIISHFELQSPSRLSDETENQFRLFSQKNEKFSDPNVQTSKQIIFRRYSYPNYWLILPPKYTSAGVLYSND